MPIVISWKVVPRFRGHVLGQGSNYRGPLQVLVEMPLRVAMSFESNKTQVKKYLEKQGSLGYEDKDTGRDRRARDQLNLLRHSLQWGLGTIQPSDGLAAASSMRQINYALLQAQKISCTVSQSSTKTTATRTASLAQLH